MNSEPLCELYLKQDTYIFIAILLSIHSLASDAIFNRFELVVSLAYSLPLDDKSWSSQKGEIIEAEY